MRTVSLKDAHRIALILCELRGVNPYHTVDGRINELSRAKQDVLTCLQVRQAVREDAIRNGLPLSEEPSNTDTV